MVIRPATEADGPFLTLMLAAASNWRPGAEDLSVARVMEQPETAHYVAGWPREGDVGLVAEEQAAVGAAWWRYFPDHDRGYGFVDAQTPEVTIGVTPDARSRGVGSALLAALLLEAARRTVPALSLSVDPENNAVRLYTRLGFRTVGGVGTSLTMVRQLQ
jgi:ribosomal protein S18 acetylase RimI-like enzyme